LSLRYDCLLKIYDTVVQQTKEKDRSCIRTT